MTDEQLDFDFRRREALGGEDLLTDDDLIELGRGVRRVYDLMVDGRWYSADEICMAAGQDGVPAREGLRRMRELRRWYTIERDRPTTGERFWVYRLTGTRRA